MQNAAIISRIWQSGTLEGRVHRHSVPLRNEELGEARRGTQVAPALGSVSVSDWCLFS